MKTGSNLCLLEHTHVFLRTDLMIFSPDMTHFDSGIDFIKINILTQLHEDWIKTMPSRVYA